MEGVRKNLKGEVDRFLKALSIGVKKFLGTLTPKGDNPPERRFQSYPTSRVTLKANLIRLAGAIL